jgi:hypothetical protein
MVFRRLSMRAVALVAATMLFGCGSKSTKPPMAPDAGDAASASADVSRGDSPADTMARDASIGRDSLEPHDAELSDLGAPGSDDASADVAEGEAGTEDPQDDLCSPAPPNGYHTVHFRYPWAGARTFTLFPNPEAMPQAVELKVGLMCNSVTCTREQDRPWFNCAVPDSYFVPDAEWIAADKSHPDWNTAVERPLPTVPGEYWLRWHYGRPSTLRAQDPPTFEFLDAYPDAAFGAWGATGPWNDTTCATTAAPLPVVGFGQGGWFPQKIADHHYSFGDSLAYAYPNAPKAQAALDAFVLERYKLWKANRVRSDAEACGTGTARVAGDNGAVTSSEGQGYGMALAAAVGDKELFAKLWSFVRRYRSQAKYCGLMGSSWQGPSDCQAVDAFAPSGGKHDSSFEGDVEIGFALVFAAMQWPELGDAARDWLLRLECEVNSSTGDGLNYPTNGDAWDKICQGAASCAHAPATASQVRSATYAPAHFRTFGDFLAKRLGPSAVAANGQAHRDFWYKTAQGVYELVERCYDEPSVHPGLIAQGGDLLHPCSDSGGASRDWARALWRMSVDAAWFGDVTTLPENAAGSSRHSPKKSRMQAKIEEVQAFYAAFHQKNPAEPGANRFSSLCARLGTDGTVTDCDPRLGHNATTVNLALAAFATTFDNGGAITPSIRREALEESVTTTMLNELSLDEALGVYSLLLLTGNLPNPLSVDTPQR